MKIYNDFLGNTNENSFLAYSFIWEKDKQNIQLVDSIENANIIPVTPDFKVKNNFENKILLVIDLLHCDHNYGSEYYIENTIQQNFANNKTIFVHTNPLNKNPKYVFYDIMFERQKLYFTDYKDEYNLNNQIWTLGCTKEIFNLNQLDYTYLRPKNILSPSRIYLESGKYHPRMEYRKKLRNFLHLINDGKGYINETENGASFFPNRVNTKILKRILGNSGGAWYPVADQYYDTSYVSAYIETMVLKNLSIIVSEKTFDPIIKGHFILPFSVPYFIEHLKSEYGFKFPQWIDYSYDVIEDDDLRFKSYLKSVEKIALLPMPKLHNHCKSDMPLHHHNRHVFFDRPFSSLHQKILNCIVHNGF